MSSGLYWSDEHCRIYHGDVFEVIDLVEGVDLVLTDPPYSSGGQFRGDRMRSTLAKYSNSESEKLSSFTGDNRDQRGFLAWVSMWSGCLREKMMMAGSLLVFSDWRQVPIMSDAVQAGGWVWAGLGVWDKMHGRPQRARFRQQTEFVLHCTNGEASREFYPDGVFRCDKVSPQARQHIAEKPVGLAGWLVPFCPPGGTVFDPFMGSGPFLFGARQAGLKVIGADLDERWCEVAAQRLSQGVFDFGAVAG